MKVLPVVAICLSAVALSGCTSSRPDEHPTRSPAAFAPSSCPVRLGPTDDVGPVAGTGEALVPAGARPSRALICEYGSVFDQGPGPNHSLKRQIVLAPTAAERLAAAAAQVDVGARSGWASCPDDVGSVTVIAFGTEPVVDLWWATSGCQSIDNGSVVAHQLANPSFGGFQAAFARVTR